VAQTKATHSIIETTDGRAIEIANQPLKGGGWVATQEDITERRRIEPRARAADLDLAPELRGQAQGCRAGRLVLVGVPSPDMTLETDFQPFFSHGGSLKSAWSGDCLPERDFPTYISLYLQGRLPLEKFVSERIGIDEIEHAFHRMHRGEVLRSVVIL